MMRKEVYLIILVFMSTTVLADGTITTCNQNANGGTWTVTTDLDCNVQPSIVIYGSTVLDCQGHSIRSSIGGVGASTIYFMSLTSSMTLRNCNVSNTGGASAVWIGGGSTSILVQNNTISAGGVGIDVGDTVVGAIDHNNITTSTSGSNVKGVNVAYGANIVVSNTTITATAPGSYAIYMDSGSSTITARFNNTVIRNAVGWMYLGSNLNWAFTNTTFLNGNGSINYPGTANGTTSYNVTPEYFTIASNNAYVNSSRLPLWNTSAKITLTGITGTNKRAIVDYNDGSGWQTCSESVCTNQNFAAGVFTMNVAHFTNFSSEETPSITAVPEFSTWALLVALSIVVAGVVGMRRE